MPEIRLALAGEVFSLQFNNNKSFSPYLERHREFLTTEKPDFCISFYHGSGKKNLFSISIKQKEGKTVVGIRNKEKLIHSFSTKHLKIGVEQPVGLENYLRVFLSHYLFSKDGLLLHASTIGYRNKAHVFTGPSGVGKSTIAKISCDKPVLTDDLVAIRKTGRNYHAFATPFGAQNCSLGRIHLPIAGIYLISHAEKTRCRKIPSVSAFTKVVSNVVLMGTEARDLPIDKLFDTCYNLVKAIPCYELPFNKNENIWRFVHNAG